MARAFFFIVAIHLTNKTRPHRIVAALVDDCDLVCGYIDDLVIVVLDLKYPAFDAGHMPAIYRIRTARNIDLFPNITL